MRRVRRVLRLMVIFYAATLALVLATNWFWPRQVSPEPVAQVICLGGGAEQGVLFENSLLRAERCGELVRDGLAETVLITGHGTADLMAEHIRSMGVPDTAIMVELASRSTLQNALFSARMTETDRPVIVVTDAYHLLRSWVSFRIMGFDEVRLISSDTMVDRPQPLLRETSAIWFNALRIIVYGGLLWADPNTRDALLA